MNAHHILSVCSVFAGRAKLSLEHTDKGLIVYTFDKSTNEWIGSIEVDKAKFCDGTQDQYKSRISEAFREAVYRGYGFNVDATRSITSHPKWNRLDSLTGSYIERARTA